MRGKWVGRFNDITTREDYEYYQDRLREALGRLTSLDDEIHELINDREYDAINKHIFLRGYLEEEPKHLVECIAVIAETYEDTKKILEAG